MLIVKTFNISNERDIFIELVVQFSLFNFFQEKLLLYTISIRSYIQSVHDFVIYHLLVHLIANMLRAHLICNLIIIEFRSEFIASPILCVYLHCVVTSIIEYEFRISECSICLNCNKIILAFVNCSLCNYIQYIFLSLLTEFSFIFFYGRILKNPCQQDPHWEIRENQLCDK